MSNEGVSGVLKENSGEIKVVSDIINDNSSDKSNSFILMGFKNGELNDEGGDDLTKGLSLGETIQDESAVHFKDIKSVEDWLRKRPNSVSSVNLDIANNDDLLSFTSSETINSTEGLSEGILHQFNLSDDIVVEETNIGSVNWEDFDLESDVDIASSTVDVSNNFLIVPTNQSTFQNELETNNVAGQFIHNPPVTASGSSEQQESSSLFSGTNSNVGLPSGENIDANKTKFPQIQQVYKKLPFVKISKNCLIKGKILGKPDISLLSGQTPISLFKPLKEENSDPVIKPKPNFDVNSNGPKKLILLNGKKNNRSLLKQNLKVGAEQATIVQPAKYSKNISNNSLLKINQNRSLLNNNKSNTPFSKNNITKGRPTRVPESERITHNNKKQCPVAVVAISTNKSDDTTQIVIKTEEGENVYKGKTSDIMKATGSTSDNEAATDNANSDMYDSEAINNLMVKLFGVTADALDTLEGSASSVVLQCPVNGCNFATAKGSALKIHVLQHYNIRPYKCNYPDCNWAFFTSFRLRRHMEVHYKKKAYQCPVAGCGRNFSTPHNVNTHLKLHERPNSIICSVVGCGEAFQTRRTYEKHLKTHGKDHAPYVCPREGCSKKFYSINSLSSHSRVHQVAEDERKCSYCGRVFEQLCRLKAHINTHIGVKPFKCDFEGCKWAFSTSSKLRRHQRKHTQMRRHVCKVCGKSFLRSEHLKDHNLKHFVKKSFLCPIAGCGTFFSNKSTLYGHLKRHRNQEPVKPNENISYPCPMEQCHLVFNSKENLRTHLQISHALANDNTQEAIQLLSDDNFIAFESFQNNNTNSGIITFNSMAQEGLLVGMSDLVQYIPVTLEQGEFTESNSTNNMITHVVFADNPAVEEDSGSLEESTSLPEIKNGIGSARTGLTYQEAVEGKRVGEPALDSAPSPAPAPAAGLHMASDVVLSAGLLTTHDSHSLLLQDDLSGGDLYMGASGGGEEGSLLGAAGELQVLLLDASSRLQHSDFEQSTINLRDLE